MPCATTCAMSWSQSTASTRSPSCSTPCRRYPGASNARRITFEYVMLKGVNDTEADARALIRLIAGIPAKLNLIPFNPWPGAPYECSTPEAIERFAAIVNRAAMRRRCAPRAGRDILAACGQLKSASMPRPSRRPRNCRSGRRNRRLRQPAPVTPRGRRRRSACLRRRDGSAAAPAPSGRGSRRGGRWSRARRRARSRPPSASRRPASAGSRSR